MLAFALFICIAFTCTSFAATKKGGKMDVQDHPENAKQGIMPENQTKTPKSMKDNQPKTKVDKASNANIGKKVEKKNVQQK
jgi:hypothetical protein